MLTTKTKDNLITKYGLSGNILKILACGFMLIDHIGYLLFPRDMVLRMVGRLAFPIFGFMVAEGCKYTRNKPKHLMIFFLSSIVYMAVYWVVDNTLYGSILTTFSLSSLIIFALQFTKKNLAKDNAEFTALGICLTAAAILFAVLMCDTFTVDYGISGVMLPVIVSLGDLRDFKNLRISQMDQKLIDLILLAMAICVLVLVRTPLSSIAHYHFYALIPIALYSTKRGYANIKYFFHIFYPVHLAAIYGVYYLLTNL